MNLKLFIICVCFCSLIAYPLFNPHHSNGAEVSTIASFHDLAATDINGQNLSFGSFKGQVVLVANTASKCGFTSQYKDLEEIYQTYKAKNLVVLGFPSNDFMNQEPGTDQEVKTFCTLKYGVTFPLFTKASVTGDDKQPVYRFLTELSGDEFSGGIKWNFEKFLIDKQGKVRARFGSFTNPTSSRIVAKIEELLAEP